MKKIVFAAKIYEAEKIIKTDASIIGYNGEIEVFSFKGISDFTGFQLQDDVGNVIEFELPLMTDAERISIAEEAINTLIMMTMM